MVRKLEEMGGVLQLNAAGRVDRCGEAWRQAGDDGCDAEIGRGARGRCGGVERRLCHDLYEDDRQGRIGTINRDALVKFRKQSMSLMVIYFGYKKAEGDPDLQHHNIILGPRYEELLTDIFERKILGPDFSQYLHIPTLTDPSLAPEGHHAAYTLIPVPNNQSDLDWSKIGEALQGQGADLPRGTRLYPESEGTAGLPELCHARLFRADARLLCRQRLRRRTGADPDGVLPAAQPQRRCVEPLSRRPEHPARRRHAFGDDVSRR